MVKYIYLHFVWLGKKLPVYEKSICGYSTVPEGDSEPVHSFDNIYYNTKFINELCKKGEHKLYVLIWTDDNNQNHIEKIIQDSNLSEKVTFLIKNIDEFLSKIDHNIADLVRSNLDNTLTGKINYGIVSDILRIIICFRYMTKKCRVDYDKNKCNQLNIYIDTDDNFGKYLLNYFPDDDNKSKTVNTNANNDDSMRHQKYFERLIEYPPTGFAFNGSTDKKSTVVFAKSSEMSLATSIISVNPGHKYSEMFLKEYLKDLKESSKYYREIMIHLNNPSAKHMSSKSNSKPNSEDHKNKDKTLYITMIDTMHACINDPSNEEKVKAFQEAQKQLFNGEGNIFGDLIEGKRERKEYIHRFIVFFTVLLTGPRKIQDIIGRIENKSDEDILSLMTMNICKYNTHTNSIGSFLSD